MKMTKWYLVFFAHFANFVEIGDTNSFSSFTPDQEGWQGCFFLYNSGYTYIDCTTIDIQFLVCEPVKNNKIHKINVILVVNKNIIFVT